MGPQTGAAIDVDGQFSTGLGTHATILDICGSFVVHLSRWTPSDLLGRVQSIGVYFATVR